jgi:hypothetical protein
MCSSSHTYDRRELAHVLRTDGAAVSRYRVCMNPLERLVGERIRINARRYEIAGFNIAHREVRISAVALDGRHERVEVPLQQILEGLFGERPPTSSAGADCLSAR